MQRDKDADDSTRAPIETDKAHTCTHVGWEVTTGDNAKHGSTALLSIGAMGAVKYSIIHSMNDMILTVNVANSHFS